jgi:hypothetical protein
MITKKRIVLVLFSTILPVILNGLAKAVFCVVWVLRTARSSWENWGEFDCGVHFQILVARVAG